MSTTTNVLASIEDHQQQTMDQEKDTLLDKEDLAPSAADDSHKDAHVQEGDTNIALEDKILQKVVQMQALWDEQQVLIEFQDQMLKLLFGQGLENGVESLSSLLVQMPATWKGDMGGITVPACWVELNTIVEMAENGVSIPSYNEICCPSDPKFRNSTKFYGKKLLEVYFKQHHNVLLVDNYRTVRGWFNDYPFVDDLRHNKPEQDKIHALISFKVKDLQMLDFKKAKYEWEEKDIYQFVLTYAQSQRKYGKKRVTKDDHLAEKCENDDMAFIEDSTTTIRAQLFDMWKETESVELPLGDEGFHFADPNLDIVHGFNFPSFGSLISRANAKRVKVVPQQKESDLYRVVDPKVDDIVPLGNEKPLENVQKSSTERKAFHLSMEEEEESMLLINKVEEALEFSQEDLAPRDEKNHAFFKSWSVKLPY
ncbi:hypothetical protein L7F22_002279 [Adiantum nelumboides]|nr:hypothetical protein [Adiantum nelumboides]